MKLKLIAIAALLAVGSAQAATITAADIDAARSNNTLKEIRLTGSSAYRLAIAGYIKNICQTDTIGVFFSAADLIATGDGAGSGARAYACKLNTALGNWAAGTTVLINKRDTGGSILGVANVAADDASTKMMKVTAASCGTSVPFVNITTRTATCTQSENVAPDAGFSDLEPELLNQDPNLLDNVLGNPNSGKKAPVDLSTLTINPYWQAIFGVVVNLKARDALQAAQGLTVGSDTDANRPSLSRTWIRNAMLGTVQTDADGLQGWGLVLGSAGTDKTVNICRRDPGSGTQATAQLHFLSNPCNATYKLDAARQLDANKPLPKANVAGVNVIENASTGDVLSCLNTTNGTAGTAYAFGIVSKENVETGTNWRYVRLDGELPNRYIAGTVPSGAVNGSYDFVAEGTMQWNTAKVAGNPDLGAALLDIATKSNTPLAISQLPTTSSANSPEGVIASPLVWSSIAGTWNQLPALEKPFASRLLHGSQINGVSDSCSAYIIN